MRTARKLMTVLSSGNLRYRNIRTMYTTDTRLTGFLGVKAVEVPDGSGGVSETLYFVNSAGTWKLAWVEYGGSTLLQVSDPGGGTPVTVGTGNIDPFRTPYGFATQRLAGARAAGDLFTHTADAIVGETIVTRCTAGSIILYVRYVDENNCWKIQNGSNGTNLFLVELVNGTPTTRGSDATGVPAGARAATILDGSTIQIYINGALRINYALATNFATNTAGKVFSLGTGGAVSDIVSWPRVPTGAALAALNLLNP